MKKAPLFIALLAACAFCGCRTNKEIVIEQAVNGNPYFQGVLAENYLNGMMYKVNYELALKWARESADKNDPVGMYALGIINEYGLGSQPVNRDEAARLYAAARPGMEKMAADNTPQAMTDLATMYLYGRGCDKDYRKAFTLLNNAANCDYVPAMADLAGMYMNGYGIPPNPEAARKLLLRAAMAGLPEAMVGLAGIYMSQQKYVPALNWYKEAASKNSPAAMTTLALMYRDGVGTEKNTMLAEGYLNQAAQMSYPPAMTELGMLYLDDKNASCQPAEGVKWYEQAIAKDYPQAIELLGNYYFKQAKDQPQAAVNAMILYQLAANNNLNSPNAAELDVTTGLYYFIRLSWDKKQSPSDWLKNVSNMHRIISGFQSGIITPDSDTFRKAVAEQPSDYYLRNDWYLIHALKMPMTWSAEILMALPETEKNTAYFWLCYGTCANLAGRPELTMAAVRRLLELSCNEKNRILAAELKDLAVIMRTSALIQRGMDEKAYQLLALSGKFSADPAHLRNYLLHFARPVLKDPAKFTTLSGLQITGTDHSAKVPKPQPFLDTEVGRITGNEALIPEPTIMPSEFDK